MTIPTPQPCVDALSAAFNRKTLEAAHIVVTTAEFVVVTRFRSSAEGFGESVWSKVDCQTCATYDEAYQLEAALRIDLLIAQKRKAAAIVQANNDYAADVEKLRKKALQVLK